MTRPHFTDDFKIDAIRQITERGYSVADVSKRLGVNTHSFHAWMKRFSKLPILTEEAAKTRCLNVNWHGSSTSVTSKMATVH